MLAAGFATGWPNEKTGVPAATALDRATGVELARERLCEVAQPQKDSQRRAIAQAQQIVGDLGQIRSRGSLRSPTDQLWVPKRTIRLGPKVANS
jgi:hypothetical protein